MSKIPSGSRLFPRTAGPHGNGGTGQNISPFGSPRRGMAQPQPPHFPGAVSPHLPTTDTAAPCFPFLASHHRSSTPPPTSSTTSPLLLVIVQASRRTASLSAPQHPSSSAPPRRHPSSSSSSSCRCICSSSPIYSTFVLADTQARPILVSFSLPLLPSPFS
jgi:hypothetical protein